MEHTMWRNVRNSAAAMALALIVAGCGGGSGGDSKSAQTPPPAGGNTNQPPTISGQPGASVLAGQQYSFQPTASDPNNDSLTFSVANKPSWAQFNASSGALTGTPSSADVSTYSGITIQVSDGSASASVGPFAITVTDSAGGVADVSWTPPTQNTDGSPVALAGYQVRYGRSANDLSQSDQVANPSVNTHRVMNLTAGTWYFAVVAVSSQGAMSEPSSVASKTI